MNGPRPVAVATASTAAASSKMVIIGTSHHSFCFQRNRYRSPTVLNAMVMACILVSSGSAGSIERYDGGGTRRPAVGPDGNAGERQPVSDTPQRPGPAPHARC